MAKSEIVERDQRRAWASVPWLPFLLGSLLLVIAVYSSIAGQHQAVSTAVASALYTISGMLLSYAFTVGVELRKASLDSRRFMAQLGRDISRTVAQMKQSLLDVQTGETTQETCLYTIAQGINNLSGSLFEIQQTVGEPLDFDEILITISRLSHFAKNLTPDDETASAASAAQMTNLMAEVEALRSKLSALPEATPRAPMVSRQCICPYCQGRNEIMIGGNLGDSQSPICSHCGNRFHAHWNGFSVLTRAWGATILGRQVNRPCPACGNQLNFKLADGFDSCVRYCLSHQCYTWPGGEALRVEYLRDSSELRTTHVQPIAALSGKAVDDRYYLNCQCGDAHPTFYIRPERDGTTVAFAICPNASMLVAGEGPPARS